MLAFKELLSFRRPPCSRERSTNVAQKQHARIPIRRKLVYAAVVVVFFFGTAELVVRLLWNASPRGTPAVGTREFVRWLSDLATEESRVDALYQEDRQLLWRLTPNAQIETTTHHRLADGERQPIRITINGDGYRGSPVEPQAREGAFRVLCLGDSNFFGYPLDDDDAFPQVLETTLARTLPDRHLEVTNGGVPGYTIAQGWRWYQACFRQHRFDVWLLSYLNNDAWLQPQTDADLFRRSASGEDRISEFVHGSRLVCWVEAALPGAWRSRIMFRGFRWTNSSATIGCSSRPPVRGTRVMILDYRAYPQYEPYSRRLREFAREEDVEYFAVAEHLQQEMANPENRFEVPALDGPRATALGTAVQERPYLWYLAEFHPEHLNEVGTAWLADQLAPLLARPPGAGPR